MLVFLSDNFSPQYCFPKTKIFLTEYTVFQPKKVSNKHNNTSLSKDHCNHFSVLCIFGWSAHTVLVLFLSSFPCSFPKTGSQGAQADLKFSR